VNRVTGFKATVIDPFWNALPAGVLNSISVIFKKQPRKIFKKLKNSFIWHIYLS
jgi:hypothetical protein